MTGTIPQPPPERPVSPDRRQHIQDQVWQDIAAARRRPQRRPPGTGLRRHLLPLVAAAVVAGLLVATAVTLNLLSRDDPTRVVTPVSSRPTPTATLSGRTQAQLGTLARLCLGSLHSQGPDEPWPPPSSAAIDALRPVNAVIGKNATMVLLASSDALGFCTWSAVSHGSPLPPAARLRTRGFLAEANWLYAPVTVDAMYDSGGAQEVVGRAVEGASSVEVRAGNGRAVVPVIDGTYAATVEYTPTPSAGSLPTARALDFNGKLLGEASLRNGGCGADPQGKVVYGHPGGKEQCAKALPWR